MNSIVSLFALLNLLVEVIHVVSDFERTNLLPENQSVYLDLWISISPFAYFNKELMYFITLYRDVTIQKQKVNEQQRA